MPTVTVRFFAVLRERQGRDSAVVEVPPGTSLGALFEDLFPGLPLRVAFARNAEYAAAADEVRDGDEVVFLPPIGGG